MPTKKKVRREVPRVITRGTFKGVEFDSQADYDFALAVHNRKFPKGQYANGSGGLDMSDIEKRNESSEDVMARIASEIESAETMDDILGGESATPVEDIAGKTVAIEGFEMRDGDFGPYALMTVIDKETGEVLDVSCGGQLVIAALNAFAKRNEFPVTCRFAKAGRAWRLFYPRERRVVDAS